MAARVRRRARARSSRASASAPAIHALGARLGGAAGVGGISDGPGSSASTSGRTRSVRRGVEAARSGADRRLPGDGRDDHVAAAHGVGVVDARLLDALGVLAAFDAREPHHERREGALPGAVACEIAQALAPAAHQREARRRARASPARSGACTSMPRSSAGMGRGPCTLQGPGTPQSSARIARRASALGPAQLAHAEEAHDGPADGVFARGRAGAGTSRSVHAARGGARRPCARARRATRACVRGAHAAAREVDGEPPGRSRGRARARGPRGGGSSSGAKSRTATTSWRRAQRERDAARAAPVGREEVATRGTRRRAGAACASRARGPVAGRSWASRAGAAPGSRARCAARGPRPSSGGT